MRIYWNTEDPNISLVLIYVQSRDRDSCADLLQSTPPTKCDIIYNHYPTAKSIPISNQVSVKHHKTAQQQHGRHAAYSWICYPVWPRLKTSPDSRSITPLFILWTISGLWLRRFSLGAMPCQATGSVRPFPRACLRWVHSCANSALSRWGSSAWHHTSCHSGMSNRRSQAWLCQARPYCTSIWE